MTESKKQSPPFPRLINLLTATLIFLATTNYRNEPGFSSLFYYVIWIARTISVLWYLVITARMVEAYLTYALKVNESMFLLINTVFTTSQTYILSMMYADITWWLGLVHGSSYDTIFTGFFVFYSVCLSIALIVKAQILRKVAKRSGKHD